MQSQPSNSDFYSSEDFYHLFCYFFGMTWWGPKKKITTNPANQWLLSMLLSGFCYWKPLECRNVRNRHVPLSTVAIWNSTSSSNFANVIIHQKPSLSVRFTMFPNQPSKLQNFQPASPPITPTRLPPPCLRINGGEVLDFFALHKALRDFGVAKGHDSLEGWDLLNKRSAEFDGQKKKKNDMEETKFVDTWPSLNFCSRMLKGT